MIKVKSHLDGLIFDMDGTIIDTEHVWETAMDNVLRRHNINPEALRDQNHEVFDQMVGRGLPQSMELLIDTFKIPNVTVTELARGVIADVRLLVQKDLIFIEGFEHFHSKIVDAGIPSSIATNCDAESLQEIVKRMNFNTHFGENIYCVADVEHKAKPDPALFLHAADKIGANPEKCIVFEDSLPGFKAAHGAGMKCVAIENKLNQAFHPQHAHAAIKSYHEAEEAVARVIADHFLKR
jgi:beta-phosphoglucomutase-like phosphatase (HAD superfamily)